MTLPLRVQTRPGRFLSLSLISILHNPSLGITPKKAISFTLAGASKIVIQLLTTQLQMGGFGKLFEQALTFVVMTSACSKHLINNTFTFYFQHFKRATPFSGGC